MPRDLSLASGSMGVARPRGTHKRAAGRRRAPKARCVTRPVATAMRSLADVDLKMMEDAARQIRGVAWHTPTVPASRDSDDILVKLECTQRTGAFKIRGAWNRMSRGSPDERARGYVCVSAGNHGQ